MKFPSIFQFELCSFCRASTASNGFPINLITEIHQIVFFRRFYFASIQTISERERGGILKKKDGPMPSAIGTGLFITVPLSCPSRPVESLKPCRSHVRSWLLLSAIQTTFFFKIRVHFFSIPFGWCKKTIKKKNPTDVCPFTKFCCLNV